MVMPVSVGVFKTPFNCTARTRLGDPVDSSDSNAGRHERPNKVLFIVGHAFRATIVDGDQEGIAVVADRRALLALFGSGSGETEERTCPLTGLSANSSCRASALASALARASHRAA